MAIPLFCSHVKGSQSFCCCCQMFLLWAAGLVVVSWEGCFFSLRSVVSRWLVLIHSRSVLWWTPGSSTFLVSLFVARKVGVWAQHNILYHVPKMHVPLEFLASWLKKYCGGCRLVLWLEATTEKAIFDKFQLVYFEWEQRALQRVSSEGWYWINWQCHTSKKTLLIYPESQWCAKYLNRISILKRDPVFVPFSCNW